MSKYYNNFVANALCSKANGSFLSESHICRSIYNIDFFEMIKIEQNDLPATKNSKTPEKTPELHTPTPTPTPTPKTWEGELYWS